MDKPDDRKTKQQALLVTLLRWMGFILMGLAGILFLDIGGWATAAGMTAGDLHRILGAMLFVMGLVDVVLMPRMFEHIFGTNRK